MTTAGEGTVWPRISVVTPSYNQASFLEETIRSVLLQGYPDIEYILIDGGSADGSLDIIKKYEKWLCFWVSEPDRGQAHAINKGFERATGQWVAWINSDDMYQRNAFARIAEAACANPRAAVIYGAGSKMDADGRILKIIPFRPYDRRLLRTRYYILQQSSFFRRSALEKAGLLDEKIDYFMDWELALRLSAIGPFVSLEQPIGAFRIHPSAKTQTAKWERKREIAQIGRRYNGLLDRNHVAFWPIYLCDVLAMRTGMRRVKRVGKLLRAFFDGIFGEETYMMR